MKKLQAYIKQFNKNHPNSIYFIGAGAVILTVILIIIIMSGDTTPPEAPSAIPQIETTPVAPIIVNETEREVSFLEPETRDHYYHIEALPGDGLYELIEKSSAEKSVPKEMLGRLASYIKEQYEYDDINFVFDYSSESSYVCWIRTDDVYWRLKLINETGLITADGEMKDFGYADFSDWRSDYNDNIYNITDLDPDIAISLISDVMSKYPYSAYIGNKGSWYWDDDDEANTELLTYLVTLQNDKFTDDWVIDYVPHEYICLYRNITGR